MDQHLSLAGLFSIFSLSVYILEIIRVLLRPNRAASSRVAWIIVILALPVLGIVSYILLGETNIGRKRVERMRSVISGLPDVNHLAGADAANLHDDAPKRAFPV